MKTDLFTDNLDALENDRLYEAIAEFAAAQPVEGWRHDYTVQWDDSSLKNVAAFANTFGGILIVGANKGPKDQACELVGVETKSEYKNRIVAAIGASISPTPPYDVFECSKPGLPNCRFCLVRVRTSRQLYMITKINFKPVYVRNEDQSIEAKAEHLRSLINRERESSSVAQAIQSRVLRLRDEMAIQFEYQNATGEEWYLSQSRYSPTFLKLQLVAVDGPSFELDQTHEGKLRTLIRDFFPRFERNVRGGLCRDAEDRQADYYDYRMYHKKWDYETRWRITSTADLGFATQMRYRYEGQEYWSIVDLSRYILLFLKASIQWWEFAGHFGGGQLNLQIVVERLKILRDLKTNSFLTAVYPTSLDDVGTDEVDLREDAVSLRGPGRSASGSAQYPITYFSASEDLPNVVTSVLNQTMRSLGHAINVPLVRDSVQIMIERETPHA